IAASCLDHRHCVLWCADVAVADDRNLHGIFDCGDPLPAGLAGVSLLARASVQCDGVESAVFGHLCEFHADDIRVVPPHAELYGEGNRYRCAHALEDLVNRRQIAKQTASAIAIHDALRRAAEIQIDEIEASGLADASAVGEGL